MGDELGYSRATSPMCSLSMATRPKDPVLRILTTRWIIQGGGRTSSRSHNPVDARPPSSTSLTPRSRHRPLALDVYVGDAAGAVRLPPRRRVASWFATRPRSGRSVIAAVLPPDADEGWSSLDHYRLSGEATHPAQLDDVVAACTSR
jgi:hypothetical protein